MSSADTSSTRHKKLFWAPLGYKESRNICRRGPVDLRSWVIPIALKTSVSEEPLPRKSLYSKF